MPRLLERIAVIGKLDLEAQVIQEGAQLWLRLSLPGDGAHHLAMWSSDLQAEPGDQPSYTDVIEQLRVRLQAASPSPVSDKVLAYWRATNPAATPRLELAARLRDALEFWPSGWTYWGGFKPKPLGDYLMRQLKQDMETVPVSA